MSNKFDMEGFEKRMLGKIRGVSGVGQPGMMNEGLMPKLRMSPRYQQLIRRNGERKLA